MKKAISCLLASLLLLFTACASAGSGSGADLKSVWDDRYQDKTEGLSSADDIRDIRIYENGLPVKSAVPGNDNDVRILFVGNNATRAVNLPEGYALTLPGTDIEPDFSLGHLRSVYRSKDYQLTVTFENQNPYDKQPDGSTGKNGWNTYMGEWFEENLVLDDYLTKNGITRVRPSEEKEIGKYTVKTYCFDANLAPQLPYSGYQLAVIHPTGNYDYFYYLLLKTPKSNPELLDRIVLSFREIDRRGVPTGSLRSYHLKENPNWNDETKAYFRKLKSQTTVDFGVFPEKHEGEYADWLFSEKGIGTPDIYLTYQHMGWDGKEADFSESFRRAEKYAGGNGFDGKPVLELTYQFTETNNATNGYTPVFDILRGKKDDYLRSFARSVKAYKHPVLFRLNNEMNTDWTDYGGMMTLNDPELFIESWKKMYRIFEEEGVDNCIWVFNPISKSCPYSNWSEALCYMPGEDYVQMLGLTNYQMNNLDKGQKPDSFRQLYSETASKMLPWFDEYPWILGEFACGAGGAGVYDYGTKKYNRNEPGRNADTQAEWVQEMLKCFKNTQAPENDFCKRIKAAVWFSANDYAVMEDGGKEEITNYLRLDEGTMPTVRLLRQYLKDKKIGNK